MRKKDKSTRTSKVWSQATEDNIIILSLTAHYTLYFFLKYFGHVKCEITGVNKYSKNLEEGGLDIPASLKISNANKRMTESWKKYWTPSFRSTEQLTASTNSFSIEYLVYTNLVVWFVLS